VFIQIPRVKFWMSIDHARRFPDNLVKSFDTLCVFLETNNKRLISLRTLFMYKYESVDIYRSYCDWGGSFCLVSSAFGKLDLFILTSVLLNEIRGLHRFLYKKISGFYQSFKDFLEKSRVFFFFSKTNGACVCIMENFINFNKQRFDQLIVYFL